MGIPQEAKAAIDEHAALPGELDPNHAEPDDDGHVWELVAVECAECGAANLLHRQKPEWLVEQSGVKWECSTCGAANRLGGFDPLPASLTIAECGHCSATFDPNELAVAGDGSWKCPSCGTTNRDVSAGEAASSTEVGR